MATSGRERGSERALPSGSEFQATGGTKLLAGNLGRAVVKVSAVAPEYRVIEAPARPSSQHAWRRPTRPGELNQDAVIVVRHNGPAANGMPEPYADAGAWQPAEGGSQGGPGHRRPLSGASGRDPGRHPRHPGSAARWGYRPASPMATCCGWMPSPAALTAWTDLSGRTQAEIDLTLEQEG